MNRPDESEIAQTRAFWAATRPGDGVAGAGAAPPPSPALWRVGLALVVALLAQGTLAPLVALRGAAPPLVVLVVVWYALREGTLRGFTIGLIAGTCEDALAGTTGIAWTLATAFAGALAGRCARVRVASSPFALAPGVALLVLARFAAYVVALRLEHRSLVAALAATHAVIWQAALAAAVAFVVACVRPASVATRG